MKNVFMVVSANRNSHYGVGTYTKQVKKFFLKYKQNFSFSLIVLDSNTEYYFCEQEDGIFIHHIPDVSSLPEYKYISIFYLLKKNIENLDNAIFIFNFSMHCKLMKILKDKCENIKILFVVHLQLWSFALDGNEKRFNRILNGEENNKGIYESYKSEIEVYNLVDKIIVLSLDTYRVVKKYYHIQDDKISLIYNGIQDDYQPLTFEKNKILRNKLSLYLNEKILLYVGRIDKMKGVPTVIIAFKEIVKRYPNTKLVIIGDGEEIEEAMKLCRGIWSKVIFTGRLDEADIFDFYRIADVGIMLSMHEQCSYVAIEMLMHNIQLITTDTTGLNEVVKDNPYKINLMYTDYETIIPIDKVVENMEKALYNPCEYNFRDIYLSNYTLNLFFDKMYKELTSY